MHARREERAEALARTAGEEHCDRPFRQAGLAVARADRARERRADRAVTVANSVAQLDRRDKLFGTPGLDKSNTIHQRQDRANDTVLWLRAAAQHEGVAGSLGQGESRICYITDDNGDGTIQTRSEVAEWMASRAVRRPKGMRAEYKPKGK